MLSTRQGNQYSNVKCLGNGYILSRKLLCIGFKTETEYYICRKLFFLSHLLIAGCDIGVQISVRPSVRSFVPSFVRPSTFTSKFSFLDISDSCESETLHINCS